MIADTLALYPERYYTEGLDLVTVATRRMSSDALDPRIKSLNDLNNIMAKIEAQQAGVVEAVMLNAEGYVAECTADNLFVLQQGCLHTPAVAAGALQGVTRDSVLEIAREMGLETAESFLTQLRSLYGRGVLDDGYRRRNCAGGAHRWAAYWNGDAGTGDHAYSRGVCGALSSRRRVG